MIGMDARSCYTNREEVVVLSTCLDPTVEQVQPLRSAQFPTWRMCDSMRTKLNAEKNSSSVLAARSARMAHWQVLLTIAMYPADTALSLEEN